MKNKNFVLVAGLCAILGFQAQAQSFKWISSKEGNYWQETHIKTGTGSKLNPDLTVSDKDSLLTFNAWGTCFNELGWDALNTLKEDQRNLILKQLFSPDGDLRFTLGRFSMNANDYSRDWYSCDEVDGDFGLKHFNIDRDKKTIIPYIKEAQKLNPDMSFWISPWSPPSWMKINHHYAVRSDAKYNTMSSLSDIALYEGNKDKNDKLFPAQVAMNDYLIQDQRYLKAYADYFCRFIAAYKDQGIPIKMVMYQNEAYSYTNYPGCAWTPEGSIRFNTAYLAPALKQQHPDVKLYLGTVNTNRYDLIDQILSNPEMPGAIKGVGFQWEGGQILPAIRHKYPQLTYEQTESECGWGSFNWKAAEHTFGLMNYYLGNGCSEYTFWNAILADSGTSGWGWKQNALIRVNSQNQTIDYTPEFYAVKHYSHFVAPGARLLASKPAAQDGKPVLVFRTVEGKIVIIAANFKDQVQHLTIRIGMRVLSADLPAHSMHTFESSTK